MPDQSGLGMDLSHRRRSPCRESGARLPDHQGPTSFEYLDHILLPGGDRRAGLGLRHCVQSIGCTPIPVDPRISRCMRPPENDTMLLVIEALTKSYPSRGGQSLALAEINFGIEEGEFVSLVGPSGCGKSTILALAAGLIPPSTGRITLDGSIVRKAGADRGMVFQQANLFPWLTVFENVTFGLTLKANRVPGNDAHGIFLLAQADSLLETVGLAAFRDHYPRQLSGRMRQRASLVRALVTSPRILLMDEPFGALDAQTREEMQELLMHLCRRQGTTVLFVTHDVEEALILWDLVLGMEVNPQAIIAEVPVSLERPRHLDMRTDPIFVELRARMFDLLRHRVRKATSQKVVNDGTAEAENR